MIKLKAISPRIGNMVKVGGAAIIVTMAGLIMLPGLTTFFAGVGRLISWVIVVILVTFLISYLGIFIMSKLSRRGSKTLPRHGNKSGTQPR